MRTLVLKEEESIELPPESGGKTILLVEDDVSNAEMFTILLQSETQYQIVAFTHGTQVMGNLETLQAAVPDLFLLDYSLPDMTGLELYDRLHALTRLAHVPALLITARALPPEIQQALQQRHIRVLAKPFDLDELLQTLEEILTRPM